MKRSLVYVMLLAVVLTGLVVWESNQNVTYAASDNATYTFPYLHTASTNVVYCVVSNFTSSAVTASFYVKSAGAGTPATTTAVDLGSIAANRTNMFTISAQAITSLLSSTVSGDVSASTSTSGNGAFYGGNLVLAATTTDGTLNCEKVPMACFQGTTSPKRNLVGYTCRHNNSYSPASGTDFSAPSSNVYTY